MALSMPRAKTSMRPEAPRDCCRGVVDDAAQGFPAAPAAGEPFVPQRVVGAFGEHVEPPWRPRTGCGTRGDRAAERLPVVPAYRRTTCATARCPCRARTRRCRPDDHDTAAGSLSITPPSDSQLLQLPSYHLCHSALSAPLANTSSRPGAQELTAGPAVIVPPSDSQPLQLPS